MTTMAMVQNAMQNAEHELSQILSHNSPDAVTTLAKAYQNRTDLEREAMAMVLIGRIVSAHTISNSGVPSA